MILAARNGYTEIASLLLSQPTIDINSKNILDYNHSFYSNVKFLMKFWFLIIFGIWKESIYKTAIDYANENNYLEIVELLSNWSRQVKNEGDSKFNEEWCILTSASINLINKNFNIKIFFVFLNIILIYYGFGLVKMMIVIGHYLD